MLCALRNQVAPYENEKGAADRMVDRWIARLGRALLAGKGFTSREMKHTFPLIAKEFATIPVTRVPKVKVGVVGEIYVKYSPLGNNDLQKFLESQDCEVNFPGLMGFVQYCAFNMGEDHVLYGGKLAVKVGTDQFLNWLDSVERVMLKAETDAGFYAPGPFKELVKKPKGVISLGAKMGEGWLLTAEMIELGKLTKRAWDAGVQVMIEGPGHMPINEIEANVRMEKSLCHNAPYYVLGPLVTDIGVGYDHITAAIGGAVSASAGADFLCYVTPAEHLCLPNAQDVLDGLMATKIAAHAADIAKKVPHARDMDDKMGQARRKLDWDAMWKCALDPVTGKKRYEESPAATEGTCTMCGKMCAVRTVNKIFEGTTIDLGMED